MILISKFASPWFLLVLLAIVAAHVESQREMRGIFLHHQSMPERAARVGAGGVERHHWPRPDQAAVRVPAREWFVDQDAIKRMTPSARAPRTR